MASWQAGERQTLWNEALASIEPNKKDNSNQQKYRKYEDKNLRFF